MDSRTLVFRGPHLTSKAVLSCTLNAFTLSPLILRWISEDLESWFGSLITFWENLFVLAQIISINVSYDIPVPVSGSELPVRMMRLAEAMLCFHDSPVSLSANSDSSSPLHSSFSSLPFPSLSSPVLSPSLLNPPLLSFEELFCLAVYLHCFQGPLDRPPLVPTAVIWSYPMGSENTTSPFVSQI